MKPITEEQLDDLGKIADKADNFRFAAKMKLPPQMHVEQLTRGMLEIRNEIRALVVTLGGEDPWEGQPDE